MDAGAEEDEGLLTQAKDDDNASGYFSRRKAYLPLSTDGMIPVYELGTGLSREDRACRGGEACGILYKKPRTKRDRTKSGG